MQIQDKIDYLQRFAHGSTSLGCSHVWYLFPGGIELKGWSAAHMNVARRFTWVELETARKSVLEAYINDVFDQVRAHQAHVDKMRNGNVRQRVPLPNRTFQDNRASAGRNDPTPEDASAES